VHYLIDGHIWYHQSPPNRWTASGSGSTADWVALDFGISRPVDSLALYFVDDGDAIKPPARFTVERWHEGRWEEIPAQRRFPEAPAGRRANTVAFDRIATARLRLVLTHRAGASSGLAEIEAWADAPPPFAEPADGSGNRALNRKSQGYPRVSASYTATGDSVAQATDGTVAYTRYSRNRWTARGSTGPTDWLEVDFGGARRVDRIEVHLVAEGPGLAAPRRFTVQYWSGGDWRPAVVRRRLPDVPEGSAVNTVWIEPVAAPKIRVLFEHARPAATAVTELLIWGEAP
jgi:hypothetical protein